MPQYYIAFWNVENLFDVEDSPQRPEWLQKKLARELIGWNDAVLDRKIEQLASVIRRLNGSNGPDILGVCEIENEAVLQRLVFALSDLGRNYGVAHHDTSDQRGIDVAFIYDVEKFTTDPSLWFAHEVLKRAATRDLFQANFTSRQGNELILIGNHWPARRGGQYETEPYRMIAAETLSYWHERIREIKGEDAPILVMGDFNDEPFNRSLMEYALSSRLEQKVERARSARLFNLMWPLLGQGRASHYYDNSPNLLDQFLVSKGLVEDGPLAAAVDSVDIVKFPDMHAGLYEVPRPFGRPSSRLNEDGFSDHFPVAITIEER